MGRLPTGVRALCFSGESIAVRKYGFNPNAALSEIVVSRWPPTRDLGGEGCAARVAETARICYITRHWPKYSVGQRSRSRPIRGDVAKRSKAGVCKTSIRRFESARRLHPSFPR